MNKAITIFGLLFLLTACSSSDSTTQPDDGNNGGGEQETSLIINHESITTFDQITSESIQSIKDNLQIYYGHTSHGSQLVTGMEMLESEHSYLGKPSIHEVSDDLGHNGDTSWADVTRAYLNDKADKGQIVMWSWCGGVSDNTTSGIDTYLGELNALETEYPTVTFVYMTGHLDGSGAEGNLRQLNSRIRNYCANNQKFLFDFEDIESYDPVGEYYPADSDACQWCLQWCAANDCPDCDSCAHSHCFNCYRKGQAFWCLLAQILD